MKTFVEIAKESLYSPLSNNVVSLNSYGKEESIKLDELFQPYSVVAVNPNTHFMSKEIECDGMTEWYCGTYFYDDSLVSDVIDKLNIDDFYILYDTQFNKLVGFIWNHNMQASYEIMEELKMELSELKTTDNLPIQWSSFDDTLSMDGEELYVNSLSLQEWKELKSKVMALIYKTDDDIIKMIMSLNDIDKLKEYIKKYAMLGFTDISELITDEDYQYLISH